MDRSPRSSADVVGASAMDAVVAAATVTDDAAIDLDEGLLGARLPAYLWRRLRLFLAVRVVVAVCHVGEVLLMLAMVPEALSTSLAAVAGRQLGQLLDAGFGGALEVLRRQVRQTTQDGAIAHRTRLLRRWAVSSVVVSAVSAVIGIVGAAFIDDAAARVTVLVFVVAAALEAPLRAAHAAAFALTRVPRSAPSLFAGDVVGFVTVAVIVVGGMTENPLGGHVAWLVPWALPLGRAVAVLTRISVSAGPIARTWARLGLTLAQGPVRRGRRRDGPRVLLTIADREVVRFAVLAALSGIAMRAPTSLVLMGLMRPFGDVEAALVGMVVVVIAAPIVDAAASLGGPFFFDLQRLRTPILARARRRLLVALDGLAVGAGVVAGVVAAVMALVLIEGTHPVVTIVGAVSLAVGRALYGVRALTAMVHAAFGRLLVVGVVMAVVGPVLLLGVFDLWRLVVVGGALLALAMVLGHCHPAMTPFDDVMGAAGASLPEGAGENVRARAVRLLPAHLALPPGRRALRPLMTAVRRRGGMLRVDHDGGLTVLLPLLDKTPAAELVRLAGAAAEGGAVIEGRSPPSTTEAPLAERRQALVDEGYRVVDVDRGDPTLPSGVARGALSAAVRLALSAAGDRGQRRRLRRDVDALCDDGVLVAVAFRPRRNGRPR